MFALRWFMPLALLATACGDAGHEACTEVREPEDPASAMHVLADGAFEYQTNPPTSGAHIAGPTPTGALDTTIADPIQVRLLEAGGVLIQYDPDQIDASSVTRLATDDTVVAPGDALPAPIVATAWSWKLSCFEIDVHRLQEFAAQRRGDAPGLD